MTPHPYTVADVMTKKVVAVAPKASFKDIVTAMSRWSVSALPVIEGEGHVVGVVSEADLLPKEEFHERRPGLARLPHRFGVTGRRSQNAEPGGSRASAGDRRHRLPHRGAL